MINKKKSDTFDDTGLLTQLENTKIKNVIVTGCTIDNTVSKTVNTAEKNGFNAIVVSDATIAGSKKVYDTTLKKFKTFVSTKDVVKILK